MVSKQLAQGGGDVRYTSSGNKLVRIYEDRKRAEVTSAEIKMFGSKDTMPISYKSFVSLKQTMLGGGKYFELDNGDLIVISGIEMVRQVNTIEESVAEKERKAVNEFIQQWNEMPPLLTDSKGLHYIGSEQVDEDEAQRYRAERKEKLNEAIKARFGKESTPKSLTS